MTGSDKRAVTWTLCRSIFQFTWRLCSRSSRISLHLLKFIIQVPQKNMLSVSVSPPTPIESQCGQNVRGIILLCFGLKGISWTSTVLIYSPFLWENLLMNGNSGCCEYTFSFSEQLQKHPPCQWEESPGEGDSLCSCAGHLAQDEKGPSSMRLPWRLKGEEENVLPTLWDSAQDVLIYRTFII